MGEVVCNTTWAKFIMISTRTILHPSSRDAGSIHDWAHRDVLKVSMEKWPLVYSKALWFVISELTQIAWKEQCRTVSLVPTDGCET